MSITNIYTTNLPTWVDEGNSISLGYLLAVVEQSKDLHILNAFIYDGEANLVLRSDQGLATYYKIQEKFWDMAYHVMHIQPSSCACWICQWRRKRQRFVNPEKSFGHLLYR